MATVTIVIVNYNGLKFQEDCIKSLYNMDYKDFEIVIVDSGSTDGSIEVVEEKYPEVKVIRCNENVGVAKGNNIGIRYSFKNHSKYTLFSNNDIVVDSHVVSELIKRADERTITVPKIYYYDPAGMLWYAGGEMNWKKGISVHIGFRKKDTGQYEIEKLCTYAPTCFMLVANNILQDVGFIDEEYFMYSDDTDLCVRVIEKGYRIRYVPNAFLRHKVSSSSGGMGSKVSIYYSTRNILYFNKKFEKYAKKRALIRFHVRNCIKFALFPIRNPNWRYILRAYKDYFTHRMGRADDL